MNTYTKKGGIAAHEQINESPDFLNTAPQAVATPLPALPGNAQSPLPLSRSVGGISNVRLKPWRPTFPALCALLESPPEVGDKDGAYLVRGPFDECHPTRSDGNITSSSLIILDGDRSFDPETGDITEGAPDPQQVHSALKAVGITHCLATTYSHDPGGKGNRYRIFIPAVTQDKGELTGVLALIFHKLAAQGCYLVNVKENSIWSQAWYFPRLATETSPYLCLYYDSGNVFDVAAALEWYSTVKPPLAPAVLDRIAKTFTGDLSELESLLKHLDPDMGYFDWLQVIMAIFHETSGSDDGLALADVWSSQGSKYKGPDEIEAKWLSFDLDHPDPVQVATLYQMVKEALGEAKYREIQSMLGPQWDLSGDTVVTPYSAPEYQQATKLEADSTDESQPNILKQFSLRGQSAQFEANACVQVKILGDLVLHGQWSVFYSAPNAGKTILTLWMAGESIKAGILNPEHVYYVNADDDYPGLTTKLKLAEEYGFHVLAPNHKGFEAKMLPELLRELGNSGAATRSIIFLDTLKKFTDPNDKKLASKFGVAVRDFIQKGGTLLALSHANKNPGKDGKPKFGGMSDIVDDADCVYMLQVLNESNDVRTVEFKNIKNRGNVANTATYQYSIAPDHGYREKMASVTHIDASAVRSLKQAIQAEKSGDTALIDIVKNCISEGVNTKTTLSDEVAKRGDVGKRRAAELIEKYTGTDPVSCHWNYTKGARGLQTYAVLSVSSSDPALDSDPAPATVLTPASTVPGTNEEA